jgi:hypothetical protein
VDHRFHFIKHAIDNGSKLGKRLVDVAVWKPLTQIAGYDTLDSLIYFLHLFLGAQAQPCASQ